MAGKRFDQTVKRLAGSRRAAVTTTAGLVLGGTLSALAPPDVRARKCKRTSASPKPAYTCPPPNESTYSPIQSNDARIAQSFTATRSGTLRQIKIGISKTVGTGDYVVQLVKTIEGSSSEFYPSTSLLDVLAAATISDAQVPTGENVTLVANFGTTKLIQGTVYAVVISQPGTTIFTILIKQGGGDCEGEMFTANGSGAFSMLTSPSLDMILTVLVL